LNKHFFTKILKLKYQFFIILICFLQNTTLYSQDTNIYLIPGQGSDYRLYKNLELNSDYAIKHINYSTPGKSMNMKEFAVELSHQIDTTQSFILIGVSLGGMLATEMTEFLNPKKVIIISSAKCRYELPMRYRFQSYVPVYKLVSSNMSKKGALFMQPIVEPDRNLEEETCISMLEDKDPIFLRRTIEMILTWEKEDYNERIIHIHGDNDNTIPIRNVKYNYMIKDGSHMMVLTRGLEISEIINKILENENNY
jgi:pimeloyl-ACP methyl ester carboxylesterase